MLLIESAMGNALQTPSLTEELLAYESSTGKGDLHTLSYKLNFLDKYQEQNQLVEEGIYFFSYNL